MWVVLPDAEIVFLGDAVTVAEPPYVGEADLEGWLESLDELRSKAFSSFLLVSGRDGIVGREAVTEMARFLRKVQLRVKRLGRRPEQAARVARGLIRSYGIPSTRRDQVLLRLQSGLRGQYARLHASKA
jgi:glyoxylase-like metal-dependent hydrolase (beta-lactamase superfamily II)